MDARRGAGTGRGRAEPALKVESAYRRRRLQHQAAPHREKCRSAVRRRAGPPASNHQLFRARRKPSPALAEAATHGVVGLAPAPRPWRCAPRHQAGRAPPGPHHRSCSGTRSSLAATSRRALRELIVDTLLRQEQRICVIGIAH